MTLSPEVAEFKRKFLATHGRYTTGGELYGALGPRWRTEEDGTLIEPPERPGDRVVLLLSSGHEMAGELTCVWTDEGFVEIDYKTSVPIAHIVAIYRLDADEEIPRKFVKARR